MIITAARTVVIVAFWTVMVLGAWHELTGPARTSFAWLPPCPSYGCAK